MTREKNVRHESAAMAFPVAAAAPAAATPIGDDNQVIDNIVSERYHQCSTSSLILVGAAEICTVLNPITSTRRHC